MSEARSDVASGAVVMWNYTSGNRATPCRRARRGAVSIHPQLSLFPRLELAGHRRRDDVAAHVTVRIIEVELLDLGCALFDLFGRDQDLAHVFVGLAEMLRQSQYALAQTSDVVQHPGDLGANAIGRLAHTRILEDLLHDLDRQHQ